METQDTAKKQLDESLPRENDSAYTNRISNPPSLSGQAFLDYWQKIPQQTISEDEEEKMPPHYPLNAKSNNPASLNPLKHDATQFDNFLTQVFKDKSDSVVSLALKDLSRSVRLKSSGNPALA
jgi:hypothetical protein